MMTKISLIILSIFLFTSCATTINGAVESNNFKKVNEFIEKGVNLNNEIEEKTPLLIAVEQGNIKMIEFLIKNGANINYVSKEYGTAVHRAVVLGNLDVIKFLVENGSDINIPAYNFKTPIMSLFFTCDVNIAKYLVDHGARVHAGNNFAKARVAGHIFAGYKVKECTEVLNVLETAEKEQIKSEEDNYVPWEKEAKMHEKEKNSK